MKRKEFKREKDVRLFVKNFFKKNLQGLPESAKIELKVVSLDPLEVNLFMPFYSEGNFIRAYEVDFLIYELDKLGIKINLFYLDDVIEVKEQ